MERVFVDTSGWVALFVHNDGNHDSARYMYHEVLKSMKALLYTSDYVIDETLTMIGKRSSKENAIKVGEVFFASKIVEIVGVHPNYFEPAWQLYKKYRDKELSFTDVTSCVVMKQFGIKKVFSFDEHFVQVGFEMVR